MRFVTALFRFWYDFIVGDAWEIAAGIVVVLLLGVLLARADVLPEQQLTLVVGAGIVLVVGTSLFFEAQRRASNRAGVPMYAGKARGADGRALGRRR